MTEDRQRIIRKIIQAQKLAEGGEGGERQAAAATVERLMKKHGISEAEISAERTETAWFSFKTDLEGRLLFQVIASVTGRTRVFERANPEDWAGERAVCTECTGAEREEIKERFAFYKGAMEKELERFLQAFVQKHKIFPPPGKAEGKDGGDINFVEIVKINAFMAGMDDYPRRNARRG